MSDYLTVIGFGSLMSEQDARRSCPNLTNIRAISVPGYTRIFNKIDGNLKAADLDRLSQSRMIANWGMFEREGCKVLGAAFEVPGGEYPALVKREREYRLEKARFKNTDGTVENGIACCGFRNNAAFLKHLEAEPMQRAFYMERAKPSPNSIVWTDNILPYNRYLAFVLTAARNLSDAHLINLLEESFLADGTTTVGSYLAPRLQDLDHIKELEWLGDYFADKKIKSA